MNNRIEYAQKRLDEAERNGEDVATLRYWAGYLDALYRVDAERAALIEAIRSSDDPCKHCSHALSEQSDCPFDCETCQIECTCKTCKDGCNFEWCGLKQ